MSNEQNDFERINDTAHEFLMDQMGIEYDNLDRSIQRQMEAYDILFETSIEDGIIDPREDLVLDLLSDLIAENIRKQYSGSKG